MIEIGNVVQLASGGPQMTVTEIKQQRAVCTWFDGSNLRKSTFPIACLSVVE